MKKTQLLCIALLLLSMIVACGKQQTPMSTTTAAEEKNVAGNAFDETTAALDQDMSEMDKLSEDLTTDDLESLDQELEEVEGTDI